MCRRLSLVILLTFGCAGCSALESLRAFVQPPRFEQDDQQRSQIRLAGDGATVRIWTRVSNPNGFGLTLGTLRGSLYLEGSRAATIDFPLGLPLPAGGEETVPLDVSVNFRDLPSLGSAISRAGSRQPLEYELEGTIGVNAANLGEQVLGPMTLLRGELR
jgi:hypothetical protein